MIQCTDRKHNSLGSVLSTTDGTYTLGDQIQSLELDVGISKSLGHNLLINSLAVTFPNRCNQLKTSEGTHHISTFHLG